jgi:hypothetical protein
MIVMSEKKKTKPLLPLKGSPFEELGRKVYGEPQQKGSIPPVTPDKKPKLKLKSVTKKYEREE